MDNIFDLDDFSNDKENQNELNQKDNIILNNNSNNEFSPTKDLSLLKAFSAEKPQLCDRNYLSEINSPDKIYNNSLDVTNLIYENNIIDRENKINHLEITPFSQVIEKKGGKVFAIEDNIEISEFDSIKNPAMKFEFTLDTFQKRSIIRLEQKKNILVCAHTSSGKTLVAEYGIALGKKNNKKVIYASPIKALSNQKYCDFKKKFKDVGIITGDVTINQNAQCLILTTEILHKFLYNQSSIMNNVGTVIFDEIHYINDLERGHVWEEILIVLPSNISIIMLSATIPNYFEFANWVGKIKNTTVYIEITKTRVVPLQYYLYVNNENVFPVKDKDDKIDEKEIKKTFDLIKKLNSTNFKNNENINLNLNIKNNNNKNEIKSELTPKKINGNNKDNDIEIENETKEEENSSNDDLEENENNEINDEDNNIDEVEYNNNEQNERQQKKDRTLFETVNYILNKKLYPATLFIFNIRKINEYSTRIIKECSLPELPSHEKTRINNFFQKIINSLPIQDQKINQISYLKNLLQYGIGVHHSGLIPILKEIIEILYFKGLIKILIATTSFSIGLNMPTKTVVFISLYKYNENKRQILSSSEFLQMSGRAGRRGIDLSGNVYIICCEPLGKNQIKKIKDLLKGEGNDLESKFRLSYRIILSFYHRNLKDIKDFFEESFHENHNTEIKPEKLKEIEQLKESIQKNNKIKCKKTNFSNCDNIDIEESPIFNLIQINNEIDSINRKIFNNEKIIEYINTHPCTILQVKTNNNTTVNKFHKPDVVMVVSIAKVKEILKLWCLTLTGYDNKNHKSNDEEIKNYEQINVAGIKGQFQEFRYKYFLLNFNDIIEIYESPKLDKFDSFYQKDNIKNYFNFTQHGNYYFKNDNKILYEVLKSFYRTILNNFPKKLFNIQTKKIKKSEVFENNKVKALDYKKIIGEKAIKKEIHKLKELKIYLKNNPCQNCHYYEKHLKMSKDISEQRSKIRIIENTIMEGEKDEIRKKLNNRINLLRDLDYLQEDNIDLNDDKNKYDNFSLTLKGKASLEIITNDNIFITELLSSDIFYNNGNILPIEVIVPFLSIFVGNSKTKDLNYSKTIEEENLREETKILLSKFSKIYEELTKKEEKYGLKESVYNRSFSFGYFNSVNSWISGKNFCDVCNKYKIDEGKLYHIIIRTFYFAEEIVNFYVKLGTETLVNVFKNIKEKLMKGIMSVESLYIQENIDINDI